MTDWEKYSDEPAEAEVPTSGMCCPNCGRQNLNTLAWVTQPTVEGGECEFVDAVDGGDNPPGAVHMIACFDCKTYNLHPVEVQS